MAFGKPVVATRVGGIVDVVDEDKTGLLVEPGDPKSLDTAITRLLLDGDLRTTMGKAGRKKIDAEFSARTMVRKISEVYDDMLLKKKDLLQRKGQDHV